MIIRFLVVFLLSCSMASAGIGIGVTPFPGPGAIVSGGGGGADYQIAACYYYLNDANGTGENTRMAVYNSAGTRIADSASSAIGTTGFPKYISHTIASGPTLTPSSTYYVSASADGYINYRTTSASWQVRHNSRSTWPSTPAVIAPTTDSEMGEGEPGMYCTNATGQVLLGTANPATFTTVGSMPSSVANVYYQAGYVCGNL